MNNHFVTELAHLRRNLCRQGVSVHQVIQEAIRAFRTGDVELAQRVISQDNVIDGEEIRIEEECLKILALYQPVAGDLRTVISCIKINSSLERMADFAAHMAERAIHLANLTTLQEYERFNFEPMAALVQDMLHDVLQVIETGDIMLAHKIIERDDSVDAMRSEHRCHARGAIVAYPFAAEYYIDCIGVARDLERIADLATDICQQIIYLRTGCITRHKC